MITLFGVFDQDATGSVLIFFPLECGQWGGIQLVKFYRLVMIHLLKSATWIWIINTGCFPLKSYEFLLSVWQGYGICCPDAVFQCGCRSKTLNFEWKGSVRTLLPLTYIGHWVVWIHKFHDDTVAKLGREDDISLTVKNAVNYVEFLNVEQVLLDIVWMWIHYYNFTWLWTAGNVYCICWALHEQEVPYHSCLKEFLVCSRSPGPVNQHSKLNARSVGSGSAQVKLSSW